MAPYAENFSNRYRVKYNTGRFEHENLWHYGPDPEVPPAGLLIQLDGFYSALSSILPVGWSVVQCEYAMAGSDVFIPTTPLLITVPAAGLAIIAPHEANRITFRGKSAGGRHCSIALIGQNLRSDLASAAYDYRITRVENPAVDDALHVLNGTDPVVATSITTIDGLAAAWYGDVTLKQDDATVKRIRG